MIISDMDMKTKGMTVLHSKETFCPPFRMPVFRTIRPKARQNKDEKDHALYSCS